MKGKKVKKKWRGRAFILIVFLFILSGVIYAQKTIIEVVVGNASIRLSPDTSSEIIESPPVGSVFEVENKVGEWYEITFLSKLGMTITGYIHQRFVRVLKGGPEVVKVERAPVFSIEAVGSYFMPSDQGFKEIYGGGTYFGGEIALNVGKGVGIWAGGHFFTRKGKTTFSQEDTEISISPVYGGLKFRVPKARVSPYFAAGVGYFKYKETSPIGTVEKSDIGYIGQVGLILKIAGPLLIDMKGRYTFCKVKPVDIEANLGGFQGAVGLGFEF
jgi:hypothetical protein